jgi:hypothetical protein
MLYLITVCETPTGTGMNKQKNRRVSGSLVNVVDKMPVYDYPVVSERIELIVDPVRPFTTYQAHFFAHL